MGAGTNKLRVEIPSPVPATQLFFLVTRAAGPEPLVGSWNSPPRKSAKRKKSSHKERGSRTTEVSLHGPAPPSALTSPSYPQSTGRILRHPRTASSENDRNQKQRGKQTIPEKNNDKNQYFQQETLVLPGWRIRSTQKKVPSSTRLKPNSTLSEENVSQQSRRSRRWNIEIERKTLQCQAESPTATQSQVKRIRETEDRTWEETSPKLKTMSGGHQRTLPSRWTETPAKCLFVKF